MKNLGNIVICLIVFISLFFVGFMAYTMFIKLPNTVEEISNTLRDVNKSIKGISVSPNTTYSNMRITGYLPTGNKTALMKDVKTGWTAAVSPNCIHFLGSKVYVEGYGVRYVNDLTHPRLDDEFGMCTLDLAVPTKEDVYRIGNNTGIVVKIDANTSR